MTKRFCPKCGGNLFKAIKKIPTCIRINENGEKEVVKDSTKVYFEIVQCADKKCNARITEDDLVENTKIKCSECGGMHDQKDLIDGLCPTCYAKKNRPDIANATQEELIAMLLEAEKKANAKEKVSKKVAAQEKQQKEKEEKPKKPKAKKSETVKEETKQESKKEVKAEQPKEEKVQDPVEEEVPMDIPDLDAVSEVQEIPVQEEPKQEEKADEGTLDDLGLGDENTDDLLPPSTDFIDGEDIF